MNIRARESIGLAFIVSLPLLTACNREPTSTVRVAEGAPIAVPGRYVFDDVSWLDSIDVCEDDGQLLVTFEFSPKRDSKTGRVIGTKKIEKRLQTHDPWQIDIDRSRQSLTYTAGEYQVVFELHDNYSTTTREFVSGSHASETDQ